MPSGNLSDSKAAIPLLKKVNDLMPNHFTTAIFDAGYEYKAIYRQIKMYKMKAVIPYVKRREGEMVGFDGVIIATVTIALMRTIKRLSSHVQKNARPVHYVKIRSVKRYLKSNVKQIFANTRIQHVALYYGKPFIRNIQLSNE